MKTVTESKTSDLGKLIAQVLPGLPTLKTPDGPAAEVFQLSARRRELTAARKAIIDELATTSEMGPTGPVIKYDPERDAQALLAGGDPAALVAAVEETRRGSLLRQLRAIDAALGRLDADVPVVAARIRHVQSVKIRPVVAPIAGVVVDCLRQLLDVLQPVEVFEHELEKRGLDISVLDAYLVDLLNGGGGRSPLAWAIKEMRERWDLRRKKGE